MHSHHSHSGLFCSHAHPGSTPEGMLSHAAEMGFKVYALSEHVPRASHQELYPEEVQEGTSTEDLMRKWKEYLVEARRLQRLYRLKNEEQVVAQEVSSRLRVLVAAETEWISQHTAHFLCTRVFGGEGPSLGERGPPTGGVIGTGVVDYLVGSVHHAGGVAYPMQVSGEEPAPPLVGIPIDFDRQTFEKAVNHFRRRPGRRFGEGKDEEEEKVKEEEEENTSARLRLCLSYFEAQYQMMEHLRPEVIGHFDLCRLFMPDLRLLPTSSDRSKDQDGTESSIIIRLRRQVGEAVDRNIRLAASYGALFEINSASLRKGWTTPYPGRDVLERIISLGGRVCLSDDAHGPSHVGISYIDSRSYLLSIGVTSIYHLELPGDHSTHTAARSATSSETESARKARQSSSKPGENAPMTFPRGCVVRALSDWDKDEFWPSLKEKMDAYSSTNIPKV